MTQLERERERLDARIAKLKGEQQPEEPEEDAAAVRDDGINRVVVKYWWMRFGKVTDRNAWQGKNGVISLIRQKMEEGGVSGAR